MSAGILAKNGGGQKIGGRRVTGGSLTLEDEGKALSYARQSCVGCAAISGMSSLTFAYATVGTVLLNMSKLLIRCSTHLLTPI